MAGAAVVATTCLRVYDGAIPTAGSFTMTAGGTTQADAVEMVFSGGNAVGTYAVATSVLSAGPGPTVNVGDVSGFAAGDLVIISDFKNGDLLRISSISAPTGPGTLTFDAPAALVHGNAFVPGIGNSVFRATSISIYLDATAGPTQWMLMLDPDGMAGSTHADAQPLIEGIADFQLAVGLDSNADGIITGVAPDEWFGDALGEIQPPIWPAPLPWNSPGNPQPRQIRATIVARTTNQYPGAPATPTAYEDGDLIPAAAGTSGYRYRPVQIVVAPRAWNL